MTGVQTCALPICANTVLTTDGTDPAWSTVTNAMLAGSIDLTSKVTGVLPVANGGSGASSLTDGGILVGSGTRSDERRVGIVCRVCGASSRDRREHWGWRVRESCVG